MSEGRLSLAASPVSRMRKLVAGEKHDDSTLENEMKTSTRRSFCDDFPLISGERSLLQYYEKRKENSSLDAFHMSRKLKKYLKRD